MWDGTSEAHSLPSTAEKLQEGGVSTWGQAGTKNGEGARWEMRRRAGNQGAPP